MIWDDYPRCKIWLAKQFVMKDLGEFVYVLGIQFLDIGRTSTWCWTDFNFPDNLLIQFHVKHGGINRINQSKQIK